MNLGQVRAAVDAYIHRSDADTLANTVRAINFAQAAICRNPLRPSRAQEFIAVTLTASGTMGAAGPLPEGFIDADAVLVQGAGPMLYAAPREFAEALAAGVGDALYTIAGGELLTAGRWAGVPCTVLGWVSPPELVSDSDTSWLSEGWPDVLTWFAIAEQHRFCQDFESAAASEAAGAALLRTATVAETTARQSGGRIRIR